MSKTFQKKKRKEKKEKNIVETKISQKMKKKLGEYKENIIK